MDHSHVSQYPFPLNRPSQRRGGLHQTLRGSTIEQVERQLSPRARLPLRTIAIRVMGALAIAGAIAGLTVIAGYPEARNAIIDWLTLGGRVGIDHDVHKDPYVPAD